VPVYVYKNLKTGETFEYEQRITESALSSHPETGEPVKRLIQPVGIAFKGSGFYVTDSRNSGGSSSKKSDTATEVASSDKTETKAESKAETKSEAKTEKTETKSEAKPAPKTESKTGSSSA
jgi:predicted nucleic acid-binding Zn ribbon protein